MKTIMINGKKYKLVEIIKDEFKGRETVVHVVNGPKGGEYMFTIYPNGQKLLFRMGGRYAKNEKVTSWEIL